MFIASLTIWLICRNIVQKPLTEEAAQCNLEFENEELVNLTSWIFLWFLTALTFNRCGSVIVIAKNEQYFTVPDLNLCSPDGWAFSSMLWPWRGKFRECECHPSWGIHPLWTGLNPFHSSKLSSSISSNG